MDPLKSHGLPQPLNDTQNNALAAFFYDVNHNTVSTRSSSNVDMISNSMSSLELDRGEEGGGYSDIRRRSARVRGLPSLTSHMDLGMPPAGQYEHNMLMQELARQAQSERERSMALFIQQHRGRSDRRAYIWKGELPPRNYSHPVFSCKIFVGGVPWDVTEDALLEAFSPYGSCKVEWPGSEVRFNRQPTKTQKYAMRGGGSGTGRGSGYVYMIFNNERSVRTLLQDCSQEFGSAGEWYFRLRAKRNNTIEMRQVQIIPWVVSDASYVEDPGARLDAKKTVFVGALHGMITAHVLFSIMNELYGKVAFVGIDTDKYKYPIGSGRVTFSSHSSYFRAIECAFLEIKTSKFSKRVQIDPFLEESECMICHSAPGPMFCRDRACFRYHCPSCWEKRHPKGTVQELHRYLTRNSPRTNREPIEGPVF